MRDQSEFRGDVFYEAWRRGLNPDRAVDCASDCFYDGRSPSECVDGFERSERRRRDERELQHREEEEHYLREQEERRQQEAEWEAQQAAQEELARGGR